MKLHLLRHAKTEPFSDSGKDLDRVLLKKGIAQAKDMAAFLKNASLNTKTVYCSDAKRTRQTLALIKDDCNFETIHYKSELYLSELSDLLNFVWSLPSEEEIFILGHNNGLSELVTYFTEEFIELSTCEYISIDFSVASWKETSKGNGSISARFHPQALG